MAFRLMHIIGARPHFMKLAPVFSAATESGEFDQIIVHSGQHYDVTLSARFIEEFGLPDPDYNLGVGSASQVAQIGRILLELDPVLEEVKPDIVFVYGDTNTTAAGAIAAAKRNIAIGHVEAGLREFDKSIPEEINKLLTDAVADLYFCPTDTGRINLKKAGIEKGVHLVGDVVMDIVSKGDYNVESEMLTAKDIPRHGYGLATVHRKANTDNPQNLDQILEALQAADCPVVLPLHPRTRKVMQESGLSGHLEKGNILFVEPLGFWDMQRLIHSARWVVTDSGGVIKEAYFHKVPCIIVDRQTEWVESVNEGWSVIAGPNTSAILQSIEDWREPEIQSGFLGDGNAAKRIISETINYLREKEK